MRHAPGARFGKAGVLAGEEQHILALDSSGKTAGACLLANGSVLFDEVLDEGLTHSQTLLPLAQRALGAASLAPASVAAYAVAAGPGSFTGLRIGMALVKGMALPHNVPVAAVSTLWAMATGSGLDGTVVCALDARRGEVYWAAFDVRDGTAARLTQDSAAPAAEIGPWLEGAPPPVFFIGDGAHLCYTVYNCFDNVAQPNTGCSAQPHGYRPHTARGAAMLAWRMLKEGALAPAKDARPSYLRLSQAERQRAQAQAGQAKDTIE